MILYLPPPPKRSCKSDNDGICCWADVVDDELALVKSADATNADIQLLLLDHSKLGADDVDEDVWLPDDTPSTLLCSLDKAFLSSFNKLSMENPFSEAIVR